MFAMPIVSLNGTGPSATSTGTSYSGGALANVINMSGGSRTLYWRFDLLHNDRSYKGDLTSFVTKAVIQHQTTRAVKRTLELDMVETVASQSVTITGSTITSAGIDYTGDLVRAIALIKAPNGGWLHFALGTFRFSRPGVTVPGYAVVRHASMPDWTSVVQQNAATDATANGVGIPLTLPPGEYVIDVVTALLQNATTNTPSNPATLANLPGCALGTLLPSNVSGAPAGNTPGDWPTSATLDAKIPDNTSTHTGGYIVNEGEDYLALINHLLFTCGCYDLMADHNGVFRIQKWPVNQDYTSLASQFSYDTTTNSIVGFGVTEDILVDDVANVVEVVVEDGNRATFKAVAQNTDANSPYSLANLGRRVVKTIRDPMVPDVGASGIIYAQRYAKQQLLMASWLTDEVTLPIAVNPLHAGGMDHDVVSLNIYQNYVAAGSAQNNPVITGAYIAASGGDPGLTISELFLVDAWTITALLASPGSGSNLTGNVGITTVLEPRETKSGAQMSLTCHRITSTVDPASITVS